MHAGVAAIWRGAMAYSLLVAGSLAATVGAASVLGVMAARP